MSSPLLALPPELLALVLDQLDRNTGIAWRYAIASYRMRYLRAVSHTSKQLRSAVEPFIFRTCSSESPESVLPFLRALCRRPRLAKHIQSLHLKTSDEMRRPPSSEDCQLFRDAMKEFREWELHDVLLYALTKGCHTAQIILVLFLATNLRQLHLDPTERSPCCCPQISECVFSFLAYAGTTKRMAYHKLSELMIDSRGWDGYEHGGLDSELAATLMRLPSLRFLTVSGSASWAYPQMAHTGISNVSDLIIRCEASDEPMLPNALVDACKSLKLFEISGYEDAPFLDRSLQHHASSLEQLSIADLSRPNFDVYNLHTFEQLRRLEINEALFADTDQDISETPRSPELPLSLKQLTIHTNSGLDHLLAIIAQAIPHLPPNLEFLALDCMIRVANRDYLDFIQELHTQHTKPTRFKDGTDWAIFMRNSGPGIDFQCRKGEGSISKTVSAVIDVVERFGVAHLLREYYADWPLRDSNEEYLLKSLKSIVHDLMRPRPRVGLVSIA